MELTITKRDGTKEPFNADKINRSIERACAGLQDPISMVTQIATETRLTLYDGITTEEMDQATINAAVQNIKEDIEYDKVAVRLAFENHLSQSGRRLRRQSGNFAQEAPRRIRGVGEEGRRGRDPRPAHGRKVRSEGARGRARHPPRRTFRLQRTLHVAPSLLDQRCEERCRGDAAISSSCASRWGSRSTKKIRRSGQSASTRRCRR